MEIYQWIILVLFYFHKLSSATNYKLEENKVPCHPCHVHISYGDTTSDITVVWATQQKCNSTLSYGTDPWSYQNSVTAEMQHFDKPTVTGLQCVYRAQLKNLKPDTTYFYRPTSGDMSSGPHFFKTPTSAKTAEFLVCGDHEIEFDSILHLDNELLTGHYDAVLHVGDLTHDLKTEDQVNGNETEEICYPQSGDAFMSLMSGMASRVPYMTTTGKHVGGDLFSQYRHWFSMPGRPWPMPLNMMWYSIDIGPVHFISYSTEVFFLQDQQYVSEQNSWLMSDLTYANLNRTAHPWIIAFGHQPMYCSNNNGVDCSKPDSKVRKGLENLFFTYGVDVIIQAHGTSYERLFPQYKGNVYNSDYVNPKAPVQLVTGTTKTGETVAQESNPPKWSAIRLGEKGRNSFARLKVYNNTHLSWEQISAKTKQVLDSIWITQTSHGQFFQKPTPPHEAHKPSVSTVDDKAQTPNKEQDTSSSSSSSVNSDSDEGERQASSVREFFNNTTNTVLLGIGIGVVTLILIISIILMVKRKQRIRSYRRWDATVDYGRKFYSAYAQVGKDDKDGSDFEVDSSEGNPSSKLLADKTP